MIEVWCYVGTGRNACATDRQKRRLELKSKTFDFQICEKQKDQNGGGEYGVCAGDSRRKMAKR